MPATRKARQVAVSTAMARPLAYWACSAGENGAPHGLARDKGRTISATSGGTRLRDSPTRPGSAVTVNSRPAAGDMLPSLSAHS